MVLLLLVALPSLMVLPVLLIILVCFVARASTCNCLGPWEHKAFGNKREVSVGWVVVEVRSRGAPRSKDAQWLCRMVSQMWVRGIWLVLTDGRRMFEWHTRWMPRQSLPRQN